MIKSFKQFNEHNVNEALFSVFKIRRQILKLQDAVINEYERLIKENPNKFNNGKEVLREVKPFAHKSYGEIVKTEGAITFSQWWEDFEKAHSHMLDRTIFIIKK